jgi:hypothetical protein
LNGSQNSQPSLVKAANSAILSSDLVCGIHLSCHHRNCVAVMLSPRENARGSAAQRSAATAQRSEAKRSDSVIATR